MVVLGFVLLWVFVVVPQRRRTRAHTELLAELAPGDEVMTAGGIYGTLTRVDDDEVRLEVSPGVEIRLARRAVAAVFEPEEGEQAGDAEERERSPEEIRG